MLIGFCLYEKLQALYDVVEGLFDIGATQKHRGRVSRKEKYVLRRRETCLDEVSGVNTVDGGYFSTENGEVALSISIIMSFSEW